MRGPLVYSQFFAIHSNHESFPFEQDCDEANSFEYLSLWQFWADKSVWYANLLQNGAWRE
jgi:hypothetical protein